MTCTAAQASYRAIPLAEITERTDVWVRGRLVSVKFRTLREEERHRFDHAGTVEVVARIQVTDSAPSIEASEITLHCGTLEEFKPRISKGRDYIAALSRRDDATYGSLYALGLYGWFAVGQDGGTIPYVRGIAENVSPDLAWHVVSDLRAGLASPDVDPLMKQRWEARLTTGGLHEFGAAVTVFHALPNLGLEPGTLLKAFERHLAGVHGWPEAGRTLAVAPGDFGRIVHPMFALLQRMADEDTAHGLVELYAKDIGARRSVFRNSNAAEPLVRIVAQHGGDARCDVLRGLLGRKVRRTAADGVSTSTRKLLDSGYGVLSAIAEYPGEDIDALLIDMLNNPRAYGISRALDFAGVWSGMAARGLSEIRTYLDKLLANPRTFFVDVRHEESRENTLRYAWGAYELIASRLPHKERLQVLLKLHDQGYAAALDRIMSALTEDDTELTPVLTNLPIETLQNQYKALSFSNGIARALPDPAFIPQLRELVKVHPNGSVLAALHACGDMEHALALAKAQLARPLPRRDWRAVYDLIYNKQSVLAFLGQRDDPGLVPLIAPFTRAELLDQHRKRLASAARREGKDPNDFAARNLETAALLALARCGGDQAITRLREAYDTRDIAARIASAMGLHALGDDTGAELVRLFAEHRELENLEVNARWRIDLLGSFHAAIRYLQNSRTDAVLLERLNRGFRESDYNAVSYRGFVEKHRPVVLRALVDALEDADPSIRSHAHGLLQRLLGEDHGYDPSRSPRQQTEAIERWRRHVAGELQARAD